MSGSGSASVAPRQSGLPPARRLGAVTLTVLIYFSVCGGAFGIEPLVGAVGPGWAAVLIVVTPLVYSLPVSLMAAELTALMPDEGGYYIWVREAFGRFWAVQEAWWTFVFGLLQLASFPLLFVSYFGYVLHFAGVDASWLSHPLGKWAIAAAVIATGTVVNLLGAIDVGISALVAIALVLGSFVALLVGWAAAGYTFAQSGTAVVQDLVSNRRTDLLLGLSVIVFNYSAWEKASSYAGEVDQPQRTYPIALAGALLLTVLSYLVPVVAGVGATTDPALWSADAGWPAIAEHFGGPTLGFVLAVGGMISMWSLFSAVLLWVSRIPSVLAIDGWIPSLFAPAQTRTGVPVASVLLVAALSAACAAYSFGDLVVVQNLAYTAALVLEILALLVFRRRLPDAPRVFSVPGGTIGLFLTCFSPLAFSALVVFATFRDAGSYTTQLTLTGVCAAGGVLLFLYGRHRADKVSDGRAQA